MTGSLKGNIMKLPRRQFLHLAAGAAAFPAVFEIAWTQTYPLDKDAQISLDAALGTCAQPKIANVMLHPLKSCRGPVF